MSGRFARYVRMNQERGVLVVQPRMGFSSVRRMRQGLRAVRDLPHARVGTITIDSFTRQRQFDLAAHAVRTGARLNGYPIVLHGPQRTRFLLDEIRSHDFPIQVRHGSAQPEEIFRIAADAGIDAIEGGPVSYCLPYGRVRLHDSFESWSRASRIWQRHGGHIESFAGCMLGQLAPPSLLVTLAILEGLFFAEHRIDDISLSYTQATNADQDHGAIVALRDLAGRHLGAAFSHIVVYTFMGVFPQSTRGARLLIEDSARLAVRAGAARLVVKTAAEARSVPTISENVEALQWAKSAADRATTATSAAAMRNAGIIHAEASALIDRVRGLDSRLDRAVPEAFRIGLLDVPYCLHPDNRNVQRATIDSDGTCRWTTASDPRPSAVGFLAMLRLNAERYDALAREEASAS